MTTANDTIIKAKVAVETMMTVPRLAGNFPRRIQRWLAL